MSVSGARSSSEIPVKEVMRHLARRFEKTGAVAASAGVPATVPIVPEPIDAIHIVVEPSETPTVVYFRRYPDLASARLAAADDPHAIAREADDGFGLLIRSAEGVIPAASRAGAG